jgi:hypothetical protein
MSLNTSTPTRRHYGSGTPVMGRNNYVFPNCYHDPDWISQWKFDDITSGSGLDSKHTNHLKSSGTLTQVAGYRQASGVQFDGTSSCFWLNWNHGSGLGPHIRTPQLRGVVDAIVYAQFGFMCSMKISDFSHDQFILSKWNEVGSDRDFYFGINTSGGIFYAMKNNGTTTNYFTNSPSGNWIPSGEWFDFACIVGTSHNNDTTYGSSIHFIIGDKIWSDCLGTPYFSKTGASGVFVIGAANYGKTPSGFFTGAIEDFRFFNGAAPSMAQYNAFHSGVAPITSWPTLNDANPYIGAHFQLDTYQSGTGHNIVGQRASPYIIERKNGMHLAASGGSWWHKWNTASRSLRPGAADGSRGSGVTAMDAEAYWYRPSLQITPSTLWPKGSFTISMWLRMGEWNTISNDCVINENASSSPTNTFDWCMATRTFPDLYVARDPALAPSNASWASQSSAGCGSGKWCHYAFVYNSEEGTMDLWASGKACATTKLVSRSGLWNLNPITTSKFAFGIPNAIHGANGFPSGTLDEYIIWHYPVPSAMIRDFYQQQSGFLTPAQQTSGTIGGYTTGSDTVINYTSGTLGGYIKTGISNSGMLGGWTSGIPVRTSGMLGGYIRVGPTSSGSIAGYVWGLVPEQTYIGGYTAATSVASGMLGGYTRAVEPVDQSNAFVAFFNIVGRTKKEFDAQAKIAISQIEQFDSRAIVYIDEKPPLVNIFIPDTNQSGYFPPHTYHFEAHASGQQGKSVYQTYWFFSDITATSGSTVTSSGTYATDHTFSKSGIFDVIFIAIDSNGLVSSDRRIINTASGYTLPTISLTASPLSGIAPLSVAFSGVINSAPSPIVDKYIYFGDGTRSASTQNIYKMYPVVGEYIPVFRVRDANGFIVTDSIVIGVNN